MSVALRLGAERGGSSSQAPLHRRGADPHAVQNPIPAPRDPLPARTPLPPDPRAVQTGAHLPCSALPTASAVRSRAPPQLRPASRLVTQQRRAAFSPAAICAASRVRPRTAMKRKTGRARDVHRAGVPGAVLVQGRRPQHARGAPLRGGGRASVPSPSARRGPRRPPRAHPHGAPSQRAGPLHQAVGVGVVGAQPLLREGQQGGPRGHRQQ